MSRNAFGRWGADLERDDFARALAAVGVVARQPDRELFSVLDVDGPVEWQLWPSLPPPDLDAHQFADWWTVAVDRALRPLRLAILGWPTAVGSPSWLVGELARPAVGVDGLFIEAPPHGASPRWRWPVKVAILDPGQSALRAAVAGDDPGWPIEQFVELVEIDAPDPCDLLLVPGGMRTAIARVLEQRLSAAMIAFLGPMGERWPVAHALVDTLMADAGTNAIAFVGATERPTDWLNELLSNLSHDSTLDQALLQTSRTLGLPAPVLLATRSFLDETRITRLRDRLRLRVDQALFDVGPLVLRDAGERGDVSAVDLLHNLDALRAEVERVRGVPVEHEYMAAAETARVAPEVDVLPPTPRFIQSQLYEQRQGERSQVRALRTGGLHELVVRVGPAAADWAALKQVFPEEKLPPADEHRLDVVLTAPTLFDEPQVGEIVLPERGASSEIGFWFRAPQAEGALDGRVIVLHEGRILQTARLRGQIAEGPEAVDDASEFALEPEALVHPLAGLAGRMRFDAALIVNHDRAGERQLTLVAGGEFDVRAPRGFDEATQLIAAKLEDAVIQEADLKGLHGEATLSLLIYLAKQGWLLYNAILRLHGGTVMANGERLQILSADAETFFPLEFVYDRPSPRADAKLCPNAEQALETGICNDCPSHTDAGYLCPLGFWCLSKVIERHGFDPDAPMRGDFRVSVSAPPATKRLRPLTSALLAASKNVNEIKKGTLAAVRKQIREATGSDPAQARSWADWVGGVRQSPPLLVLLPHTDKNQFDIAAMVIDKAAELGVDQITKDYVGNDWPIVLLLGCQTGDPSIPFQSFPTAFKQNDAAIVLATLTKVLGRYAGQVAGAVVNELATQARAGELTFGDVMRTVRRRLLAAGVPTVLAVTAYGDADWVLTAA